MTSQREAFEKFRDGYVSDQDRKPTAFETWQAAIEDYKSSLVSVAWISVDDGLPKSKQIVLVTDLVQKRCVMYVSKHSINVDDRNFEYGSEYFEDEDASYWPEGWYEENSHDEMFWDIHFTPTHWQVFPALPIGETK